MRNLLITPRRAFCLSLIVALFLSSGGTASLAAALDDSSPIVTVDRIVIERGALVTVTLNRFAANQRFIVSVRAEGYQGQGTIIATLPVTTDAIGSGTTTVPTTGLASGNYLISVASDGGNAPLEGIGSGFGVIDAGTLGPRVVRTNPDADIEG